MKNLWNLPGPGDLVPDYIEEDEDALTIEEARDLAEGELFSTPGFAMDLIFEKHYEAAWKEIDASRVEIGSANPAELLAVIINDPSDERTMLAIGYLREAMAKENAGWLKERAEELVREDEAERTKYSDRGDDE